MATTMQQQIEQLQAALAREQEKSRHRERDRIVMDLLRCRNHTTVRSIAELEALGISPKADRFMVLQLALPEDSSANSEEVYAIHAIAKNFMDRQAGDWELLLHTHDSNAYYCIFCTTRKTLTADLEGYALELLQTIETSCFLTMQANISLCVSTLKDVCRAYQSLEKLQDYRAFLLDDTPCLVYDKIAYRITDTGGNHAPEKHLFYAIRTHNFADAREHLQKFFHCLFVENRPGVTDLTSQFYRLVNPMLDVLDEALSDVYMGTPEWTQLSSCRERLLRVRCLSDLHLEVNHTIDTLESIYQKKQHDAEPRWFRSLMAILDAEFQDPQLTVAALADRIHITSVHMSRVFRQIWGLGIMDYVHQKRIDCAKQYLARGESVKSVCQQVGYTSQLTMTRAFKKYDGSTPGIYLPTHCGAMSRLSS